MRELKIYCKEKVDEAFLVNLNNNVRRARRSDHDNVAKLYEAYQDEKYLYIVSEYCAGGELFDQVLFTRNFNENLAAKIM